MVLGSSAAEPAWLPLPDIHVGALRDLLGPRFLTDELVLRRYVPEGSLTLRPPAAVALPKSTDEVASVLRYASSVGLPILTRGAGTSLTGGAVASSDHELVLDLSRMDRVLDISEPDLTATVEAGVITAALQRAAATHGLVYPPDPASLDTSTIGGNLATNAGGPSGLKYGVTRNYALALEVVLADGRIVWLGSRTSKNATGYPLQQLFIGSEGTLGVVTRAVMRLVPRPEAERTLMAAFERLDDAAAFVGRVLQAGVVPAAIEMVDQLCCRAVSTIQAGAFPKDAEAVLLFRLDGTELAAAEELETVADLSMRWGAKQVRPARTKDEADALWSARRAVSPALERLRPNKLGEDIVVPRGAIVEMVRRIEAISRRQSLPIAVFGHIGDGNLHPNILFDLSEPGERGRMLAAAADLFGASLRLGGTVSGEHGIGSLKKDFLALAVHPVALELMRAIKDLLDPKGILNPGKVLPDGTSLIQPSLNSNHPQFPLSPFELTIQA